MARKRKASAAVRARLKALRRKHGLGEFKRNSPKSRTVRTRSSSFKVARKKKVSRRKSGGFGVMGKAVIGGFIYGVARQPIQNITKNFLGGVSDEIGMLLVTGVIANFTTGQIRNAALIGMAIEASTLAKNFNLGGLTGGLTTSSTPQLTTTVI